MISRLHGILESCRPTESVLNVQGVGYGVTTPLSVFNACQEGIKITLYIYTYLKEDSLRLFGFMTETDRDIFSLLISIPGIGPSMGIAILSRLSMSDLVNALDTDNLSIFTAVPGIGKNKAEKIIFELRRKEKKLKEFVPHESLKPEQHVSNEAAEALVSLGFDQRLAHTTVQQLMSADQTLSLEACIRESLKKLSS